MVDSENVIKYIITTTVFLFVCGIIYNIISSPSNSNYSIRKYFFAYMFPLIMIFAILLNLGTDKLNRKPFIEVIGIITIFAIAIYYYALSNGVYVDISTWANYFIVITIGLVGLAIVYNSLISYMSRITGWPGFIAQLIFYLPCVLYDAWLYILDQFKLTPFAIYGFIIIEILLIIMYIYLPSLTNIVIGTDDSAVLVKNVIPLQNGRVTVATSSILKNAPTPEQISMGITAPYFPRNYCISLWVFTNPQDPANIAYSKESQILNYGHLDQHGVFQVKPLITYYGGGNTTDQPMERNKFVFYFVNYRDTSIKNTGENIQAELENTTLTIARLNRDIDNQSVTDSEKDKLLIEMTTLQKYDQRLRISSQMHDIHSKIQTLSDTIATGTLTNKQTNDLEKSKEQLLVQLAILQTQDELSPEELVSLETSQYNKMKHTFYPVTLPDQKWNQIVLNYSNSTVDLFINGNLERTFYLAGKDIPPDIFNGNPDTFLPQYNDLDSITVGDTNGIDGGICNVVYYRQPLTTEQIIFTYNQMVNSNPPVPR
jgi:hypothetical protein